VDVIRKPRTTYSSNVLRRAVPNVNIQLKKESITMVKLKVLTLLKLPKEDEASRRVKTVDNIPKILSFVSQHDRVKRGQQPGQRHSRGLEPMDRIIEDSEEESKKSRLPGEDGGAVRVDSRLDMLGSSGSEDEGSSIDGGDDDDEASYQQILASKSQQSQVGQVEDLVDKETIDLLRVCAQFRCPAPEELAPKLVRLGKKERSKVLVLDMDETLIHAKFLTSPQQEKSDDGDFIVSLASKENEDAIVRVSVKMRPFLDNCLEHLAKFYEIVVFTAGEQTYADAVLDYLDEGRQII
jgi:TFIIF-interacting CTD phosphatase-like protein